MQTFQACFRTAAAPPRLVVGLVMGLVLAALLLADRAQPADPARAKTYWPDSAPLGRCNVVLPLDGQASIRIDVLTGKLFRIRYTKGDKWTESTLNRYGIFTKTFSEVPFQQSEANGVYTLATEQARLTINKKDGSLTFAGVTGTAFTQQAAPVYPNGGAEQHGYDLRFSLAKDERLYGLGDTSRENIMRRGGVYEVWVRNVKSYIPIPVLLSNRGWGLLVNTTWRNTFDVGKSDPDRLICTAPQGDLDYYLFCGQDYRSLLDTYTTLTGRPALLPIWGYAFTYVCNENIDAFHMVNEALTFRREGMPCDVIGLEPGWMSKNYDMSTSKNWHPQRFAIPTWAPVGSHTFLAAMARKGFKLSLWLCCDYDLGVYEEQLLAGYKPKPKADPKAAAGDPDDFEKDEHINDPKGLKKKAAAKKAKGPQELEPWFEHLKKFVDQGAAAFKLDGCAQVIEHAGRKWGNGMTDEEMHNLYPVIYAKQMARGFEDYTKRRAMVYSAGGYAGVQQYVASWAGDTGGGPKPLASMLNLGFSGHSNHSCDMDVFSPESIHFGFLQTWAQQNNWAYWRQPWLLEDPQIAVFREYDKLRYKLLPYLYSSAAEAALTGYPVMRAMPLAYPDDPAWDACRTQYMLGDCLLVSAFTREVRVPPGIWFDYWSGKRINGPATLPVKPTTLQGGALLVKAGAIIPTWPPYDHVEKGWSPEVGLLVYPTTDGSFVLHEDDGNSLLYRAGKFARTKLACQATGNVVKLTIGGREGSYAGMPATRNFTATVHLTAKPQSVTLDGAAVTNFVWDAAASTAVIRIPDCGRSPRVVVCQ